MSARISKRAAVIWLTALFLAADIAASFWVERSSTAMSHTVWDICGVGLAYFILRAFFGRGSRIFPVVACAVALSMRCAQCTGVMSVILDNSSMLGRLLDRNAVAGDMFACIPPMVIILLMTGLKKSLKEKEIPLKNALIAFVVLTAVFLLTLAVPLLTLLCLALLTAVSRSGTKPGDAVNASIYIFAGIFSAFAGYAILSVQFAVLT